MSAAQSTGAPAGSPESHLRQLSPLLVWAVVFCDIGTSVYYVPGILFGRVGSTAPLFVWIGLLGFFLLAAKYVEICWRNPDGGGVVTIANQAFSPVVACLGGLLISVGYFLTSAISTVSGMHYLGDVSPFCEHNLVLMSIVTLVALAAINVIGIRESAWLSLMMACMALIVDVVVIVLVIVNFGEHEATAIGTDLELAKHLAPDKWLIGFSAAWLAFSGLESISQLSPAMKLPIEKTAKKGMRLVIITMLISSPLLTLFAISLVSPEVKHLDSEKFISELASLYGGVPFKVAVIVTASSLLLLASNTAIIGCYHVFLALAERGFLPSKVAERNKRFGTPHIAIAVATVMPILVILVSAGAMQLLAGMYAFGLLGAFFLSSISLDVIRWRDHKRGASFWIGIFTTVLILVAFLVTLRVEGRATVLGTLIVLTGVILAVGTRRKWFSDWFYHLRWIADLLPKRILETESRIEQIDALEILSLAQAESVSSLYPSATMVAMRAPNHGLILEAIAREKGNGGHTIYAVYVEERTGLFVRTTDWRPKEEGVETLRSAVRAAEAEGMTLIPIWTISYNAVEGIVRAAENLGVSAIMIGVSQRNSIYHLLRGHVLSGLTKALPPGIRLLIYG